MNKPLAVALLVVGALLLAFGWNASDSMTSGISRLFTGTPTDKAIWLTAAGLLSAAVGLVGLARS